MLPNTVEFLGRERDQERYQDAEHIRLVKIAQGERPNRLGIIMNWVGVQMVKWGSKLQSYKAEPLRGIGSTDMNQA